MNSARNSIIVFLVLFSGYYLAQSSSANLFSDDSPVLSPAPAGISDAETKALSFGSPSSAVSAIKGFLSGIFGGKDSVGSDEPKLTILSGKRHFELQESPKFEFEYSGAGNAVTQNRNPDKITGFLVAGTETVRASVYDSSGRLLDDVPIIEKTGDSKFSITVPKKRSFRPGTYTLKTEMEKDGVLYAQEEEFQWGLVSLNTKKSIYKPGETAEFIIVVLDRDGHPVCNTGISMDVLGPNKKDTLYSTQDRTITPDAECGLYNANYLTETEGNHTIDIIATIDGSEVYFSTYFLVQQDYEFDIIRTAQSKIDPTIQDTFDVTIDIESFTDADNIVITEYVPAVFELETDATVITDGDTKSMAWDKSMIESRTSVTYSYTVPHIWPYLYALGPAEISYGSETFTEARPWYVAVDPLSAPVIESYTDIAVLAESEFDVDLPTGTAAGDLLLAIIAKDDDEAMASSHNFNMAFGIQNPSGTDNSVWCWYKIANAADITRTYVTFTGDSEDYVGRMYRITGFDPDTPIDAVDTTGAMGESAAPYAPAIETVTNNALVFAVAGMNDNDVPYSITTSGWADDLNTSVTTAGIVIARKVTYSWDVSTAVYVQEFNVSSKEINPQGLFFKPDGLKMYTIGASDDTVDEYDLGTAWNASSAVYVQEFYVGGKELSPQGLFFKPDGLKMYTIGSGGDTVDEYNLSTAWNASSAVYLQEFSVNIKEVSPRGIFFKPDGLKMYTIGWGDNTVDEYNLSTAWNVSTAVYVQEFSVNIKEGLPNGVFFKPDGLEMYTVGESGDTVDEYNLSTAWNVTSAVYSQEFYVSGGYPSGIFFKPDGLKMYTIKHSSSIVDEYDLSLTGVVDFTTAASDGWAAAQVAIRANNPPAAVVLNSPEDTAEVADTTPALEFTGTDPDSDDIEYEVQVFEGWEDVSNAVYSQEFSVAAKETWPQGLFFKPDGLKMYTIGEYGMTVDEYNLSTAWDVSTAIYSLEFGVGGKELTPTGLFLKPDGLKMYTIGVDGDTVDEYNLSTAWNVSSAVYVQEFSVAAKEASPSGLFFKSDGLKMYTIGYGGDSVDEYDLSTAWNVSTVVYVQEFSVSTYETSPTGLFFKPDGLKMYTMGYDGGTVDEYNLSTAWNVSTAVYSREFSVAAKEASPTGLFFKPDGLKMYTTGLDGDTVDEYDLSLLIDKFSSIPDAGFLNTEDGGDTHPFTSAQKISYTVQVGDELSQGTYSWRARGKDPLGVNTSGEWSGVRSFMVTTPPPVVTIISPGNGTYQNTVPTLNGTCTDTQSISTIWTNISQYSTADTDGSPFGFINTTSISEQRYDVKISCNNTVGKTGYAEFWFIYDPTQPNITFVPLTDTDNDLVNRNYSYVNVSVSDEGSPNNLTSFIDWNNSLVGWWRFNEEAGENETYFRDWSSWGNNGTCTTTTCPNYTTGKFGKGMEFDGTGYVKITINEE